MKNYLQFKNIKNNLAIYFTAGYPQLDSTLEILLALDQSGVDLIEVGLPFSDSLVDGPVIQASNQIALNNGQSVSEVLNQLKSIKDQIKVPIVLMGSYNPLLQFGMNRFVTEAKNAGVSAVIIPDLPAEIYEKEYQGLFEEHRLGICFLVTSHTKEERVRYLDSLTTGFLYLVSSDSITGGKLSLNTNFEAYMKRIASYNLSSPLLVGFGISDNESFKVACLYSNGAIIGSDFIRSISQFSSYQSDVKKYVDKIKLS